MRTLSGERMRDPAEGQSPDEGNDAGIRPANVQGSLEEGHCALDVPAFQIGTSERVPGLDDAGWIAALVADPYAIRSMGDGLVEITEFQGRAEISRNEFVVLLAELKSDLNAYLAEAPPSVATRTLADVIAFNRAQASIEMPLFGQELFEQAEGTSLDSAYRQARATSARMAGPEGIDRLLREHDVVALIGPTMPPAWLIDSVNGDQYPGAGAGSLAAVAGYPHLTVPMGAVRGLPVGLSFIGAKWSDGLILSLGYAFEQASRARVEPRLIESIEESEEVARHLRPASR